MCVLQVCTYREDRPISGFFPVLDFVCYFREFSKFGRPLKTLHLTQKRSLVGEIGALLVISEFISQDSVL